MVAACGGVPGAAVITWLNFIHSAQAGSSGCIKKRLIYRRAAASKRYQILGFDPAITLGSVGIIVMAVKSWRMLDCAKNTDDALVYRVTFTRQKFTFCYLTN